MNAMNEQAGRIFSIPKENEIVPRCTISKSVYGKNGYYISYFSLGANTDITPESYRYHKIWLVLDGSLAPISYEDKRNQKNSAPELTAGEAFLTPVNTPIGTKAGKNGAVYMEISLKEDTEMNEAVQSKQVFALKDLIPYSDGRIINMDIVNNEHMKFVIMSFTAGTGLPTHAAPGEALITALDGEATIVYEGQEYRIHAGENFKFDKGGAHAVKADQNFKMSLLLTFDEQ